MKMRVVVALLALLLLAAGEHPPATGLSGTGGESAPLEGLYSIFEDTDDDGIPDLVRIWDWDGDCELSDELRQARNQTLYAGENDVTFQAESRMASDVARCGGSLAITRNPTAYDPAADSVDLLFCSTTDTPSGENEPTSCDGNETVSIAFEPTSQWVSTPLVRTWVDADVTNLTSLHVAIKIGDYATDQGALGGSVNLSGGLNVVGVSASGCSLGFFSTTTGCGGSALGTASINNDPRTYGPLLRPLWMDGVSSGPIRLAASCTNEVFLGAETVFQHNVIAPSAAFRMIDGGISCRTGAGLGGKPSATFLAGDASRLTVDTAGVLTGLLFPHFLPGVGTPWAFTGSQALDCRGPLATHTPARNEYGFVAATDGWCRNANFEITHDDTESQNQGEYATGAAIGADVVLSVVENHNVENGGSTSVVPGDETSGPTVVSGTLDYTSNDVFPVRTNFLGKAGVAKPLHDTVSASEAAYLLDFVCTNNAPAFSAANSCIRANEIDGVVAIGSSMRAFAPNAPAGQLLWGLGKSGWGAIVVPNYKSLVEVFDVTVAGGEDPGNDAGALCVNYSTGAVESCAGAATKHGISNGDLLSYIEVELLENVATDEQCEIGLSLLGAGYLSNAFHAAYTSDVPGDAEDGIDDTTAEYALAWPISLGGEPADSASFVPAMRATNDVARFATSYVQLSMDSASDLQIVVSDPANGDGTGTLCLDGSGCGCTDVPNFRLRGYVFEDFDTHDPE